MDKGLVKLSAQEILITSSAMVILNVLHYFFFFIAVLGVKKILPLLHAIQPTALAVGSTPETSCASLLKRPDFINKPTLLVTMKIHFSLYVTRVIRSVIKR